MAEVSTSVVITAAGSGQRFGQGSEKLPKQFASLNGKPLLYYSLNTFSKIDSVHQIVLVVPRAHVEYTNNEIVRKYGFQNKAIVIEGGKERQDSVEKGFNALNEKPDVVLVHDGVRPFINSNTIKNVIGEAFQSGASICAVKATDTVKQSSREHYIENTLDRDTIWLAQTPQGFKYEILKDAIRHAGEDSYLGTDESLLVERIGVRVKLTEGSRSNIKITTKEDIILGEFLIKEGVLE